MHPMTDGNPEKSKADFRLPTNVVPRAYKIFLAPNLERGRFEGDATIDIEVREPTTTIELHAKKLDVPLVYFYPNGQSPVYRPAIRLDLETERLILTFDKPLPVGPATLELIFDGILNDNMSGFYRSSYAARGKKHWMATTQFEDTDARQAFPCFDEPALKATFKLTLSVPKELEAVSNTPVETCGIVGDKKIVEFKKTPVMSTYLVAFMVGEFEWIEGKTKRGTEMRVITTPGKSQEGAFALDVGLRALEFYEDYFGIPFPLPKLDMAAIPDFAFGAMENWGLITYRETAVLFNPAESSGATKQRVAIVITHEIAHQWFGNLVTMMSFRQLWLNEGFATWMEHFAVDRLFPEWKIWEQFVADAYTAAKAEDALRSTHPVEIETDDPAELRQSFDAISYEKGASIIRMIHAFIGPDAFRAGLHAYLETHAYKNTVTEDLWDALEKASGKPVRAIMDCWTKQAGYPMITVTETPSGLWLLDQSRFLASGSRLTPDESSRRWHIPLNFRWKNPEKNALTNYAMRPEALSTWINPKKHNLLLLNDGMATFARVAYPPSHWAELREIVAEQKLEPADRLGLLDDLYALVRAGALPTPALFEFLEAYKNERNYVVSSEVVSALGGVVSLLENTASFASAKKFALSIVCGAARELGWEEKSGEDHLTQLMRPMMLGACGSFDDAFVVDGARAYFSDYCSKGPNSVPANLRLTVLKAVALHPQALDNGLADFNRMLAAYRASDRSEEKTRILTALGAFESKVIVPRLHEFMMSDEVRSQDLIHVFRSIGPNVYARNETWKFLMDHFDEFKRRYEDAIPLVGRMLESVLGCFASEESAQEIERFFAQHPTPELSRSVAKSIECIRMHARWLARDGAVIEKWLSRWTEENKPSRE